MPFVPANSRQTAVWPVPLQNQPGCRSISDDDLCAWCRHLCYRPGELSLCRLSVADGIWPSRCNDDGYAQSCLQLCLNVPPADITSQ
ncbi:hypothetical protein FOT62_00735 [Serratia marcescens]|uniref:Antirestriction protein n=1 Tax=Serratia marcescens TaxID=615 RepID=A0A5C7CRH0_SERMA|nr:hypothetical protein FOT62_00735 [Serratia marcescens]TXE68324.1 hypothetical protein FOT56_00735 [Serratia marcescens]